MQRDQKCQRTQCTVRATKMMPFIHILHAKTSSHIIHTYSKHRNENEEENVHLRLYTENVDMYTSPASGPKDQL